MFELCLLAIIVIVPLSLVFHYMTRNDPAPPAVPPCDEKVAPAKLISKTEAWHERPSYDYQHTSIMGAPVTPIEPGDSDPPEPYE